MCLHARPPARPRLLPVVDLVVRSGDPPLEPLSVDLIGPLSDQIVTSSLLDDLAAPQVLLLYYFLQLSCYHRVLLNELVIDFNPG